MKKLTYAHTLIYSHPFPGGTAELHADGADLRISLPYAAAYGAGERFNTLNLKNHDIHIAVEEKFCEQGDKSYCPMPFFFTDSGFGIYVASGAVMHFHFGDDLITLSDIPQGTELTLFSGYPQSIIAEYMSIFSRAALPPEWAFKPWISANCWNTQAIALHQLMQLKKHDFPAGVIVLEAWSDEATFYIFNDAEYAPKPDGAFDYADFTFSPDGPWPDPKAMIDTFHAAGLKVILWQVPVYKALGADEEPNAQLELDWEEAVTHGLCVKQPDGSPYTIPVGHWFSGAMIPDFSHPETKAAWFRRRRYLLEIGVDGFKTDGGEFIYRDDLRCHDAGVHNIPNGAGTSSNTSALQTKNSYAQSYIQAYKDFITPEQILFSRAGFVGQHTTPILWAGDQLSTFAELRAQLRAGLSAAMSGIIFWGFDIGGFAGPLPSADLYLRATQLACFCPIMQWHSELVGGQFSEMLATDDTKNERSPWNIAQRSGDPVLLDKLRFYYKLREELLPYIYTQAQLSVTHSRPLIYPLAYTHIEDATTHDIADQFMLGDDYLIAPILAENTVGRQLYLPAGTWTDYWSGEQYDGQQHIYWQHEWHIPIFRKVSTKTLKQEPQNL